MMKKPDNQTIDYRSAEMLSAFPFPLDDPKRYQFGLSIQMRSEYGKTKYLNLTAEEVKKIELILLGA
jgi:hypothetical protein